ncbi:tRNA-binding protein [Vandammella animalimorsus]|uniref:tRNA-binding protein n=1 Tax=Vandammella animalimorsus TaxID=2029117 RepID=UPI0031B9B094
MEQISFDDFLKVELRVGRVVQADAFPQARKPAYVLHVDFGPELGVKKSSAQITDLYQPQDLVPGEQAGGGGGQLFQKQVGPLMSECLLTGFHNAQGHVALCVPDQEEVPLGARPL